jgi:ferritin-like metal-binding protein YciE
MSKKRIEKSQLHELLYQALETELGGVKVYRTALGCALNEELRAEWEGYLEETENHCDILLKVFSELGLDPDASTPGRAVVAHIGESLVKAMEMAKAEGSPEDAQLVAGECVVHAETKDHLNWSLIGLLCEKGAGSELKILKEAFDQVEEEENHHLFHSTGWTRELWIESLGLPAVLPPPEEVKHVETPIGASRAAQARDTMLKSSNGGSGRRR